MTGLYVLYVDESGVPKRGAGTTSHYALAGASIPSGRWATKRNQLARIRSRYGFEQAEIHTTWLLRTYPEQAAITGFTGLATAQRRDGVNRLRAATLASLRAAGQGHKATRLAADHRKSRPYIHLTLVERQAAVREIATLIGSWGDLVLFGEVVDKSVSQPFTADESAFEQVLTRFEAFLLRRHSPGIVAYDANETIVERYTHLMDLFQRTGGIWRRFVQITAHPFFVGSDTSDMIQVADVVAYGLRRYCENGEWGLLQSYFSRFDRRGNRLVGLRHYRGGRHCACMICREPR